MSQPNKISGYIKTVCEQIRWKKAHPSVAKELSDHITDQQDAFLKQGMSENEAEMAAIKQMGDPVVVGTQLDGTYRPKPNWVMLLTAATLVFIGALIDIILKAYVIGGGLSWIVGFGITQVVGLGLMAAAYFMDFTWFGRHSKLVYLSLLIFTVLSFILFTLKINWKFNYYIYYIALLFPIGFAGVVYSTRKKGFKGILLCEIAFLLPALILLQMGIRSQFMIFAVSAFVILCIAIAKGWFKAKKLYSYLLVLIPAAIALIIVAIVILTDIHKIEALRAAFNPSYDANNINSIDSMGAEIKMILDGSKLIGRGTIPFFNEYGPGYSISNFITYTIFYYGWISVIPILGVVLFFIVNGFRLCMKQKGSFGQFISTSIMTTFTIQTILYLLLNFGIDLHLAPWPHLPFVMQSDSREYIINLALVGVMMSVFRTGHVVKDNYISTIRKHHSLI